MTIKPEPANYQQIDDAVVESYFGGMGGTGDTGGAAAMSMMAHGHNLPSRALDYRLRKELATIGEWLDMVGDSGRVLDLGCGAGAWVEIFAQRYQSVIGVERSPLMAEAARKRVAHLPNAHILQGDTRKDLPEGPYNCHCELSCSGGAPPIDENGFPSAHGSTGSPRAVGIPFVLRLSKSERAISRAAKRSNLA